LSLVTMASLASLAGSCAIMARRAGWDRRHAVLVGLTVAAIGTTAEPVRWTIFLGQVNLILLGMVAADCLAPRTRWPRGLLIGIAAAIKLTPLVFVLFFLPQRQWRTSTTAIGSFVAASLLGVVVAPIDSREYWLDAALDPSRIGGIGYAGNQSLRGALHRLGLPVSVELALWLGGATAVVIACSVAVHRLRNQGQDTEAVVVVAATGLLCSPVSWSHHWVWAVPGAVLLVRRLPARSACLALAGDGLVFLVAPHWRVPHADEPERWAIWQHIAADSYVWIALAVVFAVAIGNRHPLQRYMNGRLNRSEQSRGRCRCS
jgi:alpha-1,2-mannosyltransferase